jgi:hypothetical protein
MSTLKHEESSYKIIDVTELRNAEDDVRILKLEKEIVSFALDHIDKAETEGKLNEEKRLFLKNKYLAQERHLEKQIEKKEKIIDIHKLQEKKEQLMRTFQEKLDKISKNIESIEQELEKY